MAELSNTIVIESDTSANEFNEQNLEDLNAVKLPSVLQNKENLDGQGGNQCNNNGQMNNNGDDDDEDGRTCPICMEVWTSNGQHRIVSLSCGHLFGYKCILQWINSSIQQRSRAKCPQCNKPARRNDIRQLFLSKLTVIDNSELADAQLKLASESRKRLKLETELGQLQLAFQMCRQERDDYRQQMMHWQQLCDQIKQDNSIQQQPVIGDQSEANQLSIQPVELLSLSSESNNSNVVYDNMQIDRRQRLIFLSVWDGVASSVMIVNLHDTTMRLRVDNLHKRPIKCLAVSNSGYLASVSLDKVAQIVKSDKGVVVHTLQLPCAAWSCCFDESGRLYVGTSINSIIVYDLKSQSLDSIQLKFPEIMGSSMRSIQSLYWTLNDEFQRLLCHNNSGVYHINLPSKDTEDISCQKLELDIGDKSILRAGAVEQSESLFMNVFSSDRSALNQLDVLEINFDHNNIQEGQKCNFKSLHTQQMLYSSNQVGCETVVKWHNCQVALFMHDSSSNSIQVLPLKSSDSPDCKQQLPQRLLLPQNCTAQVITSVSIDHNHFQIIALCTDRILAFNIKSSE
ncbi:hypothetical protein MP228_003654 [Amoeboaphelidium protococcarum]|nr:hypothetical protein MP228_003654 [Amoeboaphelidium protococcarum]